jgi:hypothetical protein
VALILPDINGSSGVWGGILNTALNDLDGRTIYNREHIDDIESGATTIPGTGGTGGFTVCTSTTLPAPAVGQITLETDTGYLSYCASVAGVATRVPFPGSWVARYRKLTPQAMGSGSQNMIAFDSISFDRLGSHNVANPSRFTATIPGSYEFTGGVSWESNNTGWRRVSLFAAGTTEQNGTTTIINGVNGSESSVNLRPTVVKMLPGNFVELGALHNATVTLDVDTATGNQPTLNVKYLGYNV